MHEYMHNMNVWLKSQKTRSKDSHMIAEF